MENRSDVLSNNRSVSEIENLLAEFARVRKMTEWICEPLEIEDYVIQTSTECSPTKWQLGHTTWFFETFILKPHFKGYQEYQEKYNYLFNSYYNAIGDRVARPVRGLISRPTVAEILEYRRAIDDVIRRLLSDASIAQLSEIGPLITLGLNHEQQHQELIITDVKTVYGLNPLRPVYREREIASSSIGQLQWVKFDEGVYPVGHGKDGFFFDNEAPAHKQYLNSFALSDRLITNAEYQQFIEDGGYRIASLWLSEGLAMRDVEKWEAPMYWEKTNGQWFNFTLQGFRPVEASEPVTHISQFEADAFATWYGARLATEFEWEVAARGVPLQGNFLDRANFQPVALHDSVNPIKQLFGDVWEWTRSAYLPYPGYKPVEGALGEYNGKFMSNQMVLRGGSCATPQDHIRATYRNFFPSGSRWQFSGIRLAKDI